MKNLLLLGLMLGFVPFIQAYTFTLNNRGSSPVNASMSTTLHTIFGSCETQWITNVQPGQSGSTHWGGGCSGACWGSVTLYQTVANVNQNGEITYTTGAKLAGPNSLEPKCGDISLDVCDSGGQWQILWAGDCPL